MHGAPPSVGQGEADVGLVELMSVPKTDGLGRDAPFKTEVERGAQEGGGPMERTRTNRDNNKSSQNRDKIEQQQIETKSRQNRTTTNRDKSRQKKSSTTNRDKSRQKKIINNKSRQIETKNRTTTNRDKSGQKKIINNRSRRQHIEAKPRQKKMRRAGRKEGGGKNGEAGGGREEQREAGVGSELGRADCEGRFFWSRNSRPLRVKQ